MWDWIADVCIALLPDRVLMGCLALFVVAAAVILFVMWLR
jgi:hypothetical protein